jgi:hypothetical protein
MTPTQWKKQLSRWGVEYREIPGWEHWERDDETGLKFGPVYGFIIHHTGDDAPDGADRALIHNGRTGLPGPLAQLGGNDDGVLDLHSAGRANHAGGGDPRVLEAVKAENYGKYPPKPRFHTGSNGAWDGNDNFYGLENYYSGKHKMTDKQYRTVIMTACAICEFHDWTAKSVIGHKEWSDWKSDPASHDMAVIRLDINENLRLGPPKLRDRKPNTHVTRMRSHLAAAVKEGNLVSEDRKLIASVTDALEIQLSRLPER